MSAARSRFLIEGLRGKKQGIEMAVDNFVRAVGCRDGFDYLLHEAPLGLKTLMGDETAWVSYRRFRNFISGS